MGNSDRTMTLADIANATSLDPRALRYVVDHELVPNLRSPEPGRGIPRVYAPDDAYAIALAALLQKAGLGRRLLRVGDIPIPKVELLVDILPRLLDDQINTIEINDQRFLRTRRGEVWSPWLDLLTGRDTPVVMDPYLVARIDAAGLRAALARKP